jgi:hypothetical protein
MTQPFSSTTAVHTDTLNPNSSATMPAIQQPVGGNCDPCIKVSTSASLYDPLMEQRVFPTFEDYVEFNTTDRSTVKGGRHTCGPMRKSHHSTKDGLGHWRRKENALPFNLVRHDIDGLRDMATFKAVCVWLMAQHNCIIYETSSSTPEQPRCRVEMPLNRPVSQDDMTRLCLAIEGDLVREFGEAAFPTKNGGLSFDRSVYSSYQPCLGPLEGAAVYTQFDLEPIDVTSTLARAEVVENRASSLTTTPATIPETEANKTTLVAALAAIPASVAQGTDRNKYRSTVFGVMSLGWDSGRDIADAWSQTAPTDYDEGDFNKICDSYDPYRSDSIKIGTVEFHARQHGWKGQFEFDTSGGIGGFRVGAGFLDLVQRTPEPEWIQEGTLLKGYISLLTAPGGVGKSTLQLCLAISVASGQDLLKLGSVTQGNVIVVNNEDDSNVLVHRIGAIMKYFGLSGEAINDRLHVYSGYGKELAVAHTTANGEVVLTSDGQTLQRQILDDNVQAIFLDPFISLHDAPENDNVAVNKAVKLFKAIAAKTGCAISLIHHTRKMGKDSEMGAGDAEAGRGASSLKDAARVVLTLAKMSQETGNKIDITEHGNYIRLDTGKSNFSAPDNEVRWYQLTGVATPAGNTIGVPNSVNLEPLFEASKHGTKWTTQTVTSALTKLMQSDGSVSWPSLKVEFQNENDVKKSRSAELIAMLPTSEVEADPTINGVVVWATKTGARGSTIIHKKTDPGRATKSVAGMLSIQCPDETVH